MKTLYKVLITIVAISLLSCEEHLTELNVNPNGVDPAIVNPNLLVPTVIVSTAYPYLEMNYNGHTAGVMQYVQLSGWSDAPISETYNICTTELLKRIWSFIKVCR